MNLKTNNMTKSIELTVEKIKVVSELIILLEEDILNPDVLTHQMLKGLIVTCQHLINSDF